MRSSTALSQILDVAFAKSIALRASNPDLGENNGPSTTQIVIKSIIGTPEGRSIGSPGDLRIRQDDPQVWQKASGIGTTTGWRLLSGAVVQGDPSIELVAGSGGDVSILTGGTFPLRFGTFSAQGVVVPVGTTILAPITTLTQNGRTVMIDLKSTGVDAAVLADVGTFFQVNGWRRAAGASAPIPAQIFDKRTNAAAGTFATDVTIAAALNPPNDIVLVATNGGAGARTGHVTANWSYQDGGVA